MVFSSLSFIFLFLPIFLILDKIIQSLGLGKYLSLSRNYLLIFASLLFYIWGEDKGVFLLIALAVCNLIFGKTLIYVKDKALHKTASFVLFLGVFANLAVLIYYKYLFWIVSQLAEIPLFSNLSVKDRLLPLGISFFTFHAISYLVDIYKNIAPKHKSSDFFAYYFMFPHLVAGPIVRFKDVCHDLQNRQRDFNLFAYGAFRFILGVNKKVLIANSAAPIADLAFVADPSLLGSPFAWLGILAYTVQIYFDFSGYSDMAIGLAAMMGIKFKENFNSPYKADCIKDFWRRWHISLSTWLRDYLYIPLGGNRCSTIFNYRNLVVVFIICGLWHGAAYTFLVWGTFHGLLLIFERTALGKFLDRMPKFIKHVYLFLMITIAWVFFRAENINSAFAYIFEMFSFKINNELFEYVGNLNILLVFIGLIIAFFGKNYGFISTKTSVEIPSLSKKILATNLVLFLISIAYLYSSTSNPFIYFNF